MDVEMSVMRSCRSMKKFQAVVTALVLSFAIAGCKKKEEKAAEPPKTDTTAPATTGSAATPPATPPAAAVTAMPDECQKLKDLVDKVATCEKLPPETRDGMKKSWDLMTQSLKDWDKMGADNQATVKKSCTQAAETMQMVAKDC